jgi:hypothetical protein
VIGHNPENADYSNPRGAIHGLRGSVVAEAPDGSRWVFDRTITARSHDYVVPRLEAFAEHVMKTMKEGRKLDPSHWQETRPAYGSKAYVDGNWQEQDYVEERFTEQGYYV